MFAIGQDCSTKKTKGDSDGYSHLETVTSGSRELSLMLEILLAEAVTCDERGKMTGAVNRLQLLKRRTSRMALNARIALSGQDREKCTYTLSAVASGLNRHGAAVQVNRELIVGSTVVLRNNRHTQASARVVKQVNAVQGTFTYGVEFQEGDADKNFWGITFPKS